MSKENVLPNIKSKIEIKEVKITAAELEKYAELHRQGKAPAQGNLNQYLHSLSNADRNTVLIADLSDLKFDPTNDYRLDLTGIDLTGCKLAGAEFINCDLSGAIFRDTDLTGVSFESTKLTNADFRGAELYGVKYSYNPEYFSDEPWFDEKEGVEGIKFSFASKENLIEYLESREFSKGKGSELPLEGMFSKGDVVYTIFDPTYKRGSTNEEAAQKKVSKKVTKELLDRYLLLKVSSKNVNPMSFAEFMKQEDSELNLNPDEILVPDFSDMNLSSYNLSNCNFVGCNFANSVLINVKFTNSNLSGTTFENANLADANFKGSKVDDANFFRAKLLNATIDHASFRRAYLANTYLDNLKVSNSNLDFSSLKHAAGQNLKIHDSSANNIDATGVVLTNADIRRVQAQKAIFADAIMEGVNIIESDLTNANMQGLEAVKAKFIDTILTGIKAQAANLTDAEFSEFTKLDGADLRQAILIRIKAAKVSLINANLDMANLEAANIEKANLEGAKARFANFEKAVMDDVNAHAADLSDAVMNNVKAKRANFNQAKMRRIEANDAVFSAAQFEEADLREAEVANAMLEQVNLKKAQLQGANLQNAEMNKANVDGAIIDARTNLHGAKMKNLEGKGEVTVERADGTREEHKDIRKQQELQDEVLYWEKHYILGSKPVQMLISGVSKTFKTVGDNISKLGGIVKHSGLIIGALIGIAFVALAFQPFMLPIIASVGLAAMIGIAVGSAIGFGIVGGIVGHVFDKKFGVGNYLGTAIDYVGNLISSVGKKADKMVIKEEVQKEIDDKKQHKPYNRAEVQAKANEEVAKERDKSKSAVIHARVERDVLLDIDRSHHVHFADDIKETKHAERVEKHDHLHQKYHHRTDRSALKNPRINHTSALEPPRSH